MGTTTIQVSDETKAMLDARKIGDESYDAALQRLLSDDSKLLWDEHEIRDLAWQEANSVIEEHTGHHL